MTVQVRVVGDNPEGALRDLYAWLSEEPELRGRVRIVEAESKPGALGGGVPDLLQVALGAGGAFATMATVLVAWLGTRRSEVTVKVSRGVEQNSVELSAKGIKGIDAATARELTEQIVEMLNQADAPNTGDMTPG